MWMKLLYSVQDHRVGRLNGYVHWFEPIHARPCLWAGGALKNWQNHESSTDDKESSKELYIPLCETLQEIETKKWHILHKLLQTVYEKMIFFRFQNRLRRNHSKSKETDFLTEALFVYGTLKRGFFNYSRRS